MLLETVLAIVIMTVVGLSLIALVQKAAVVSVKTRQHQTCARMMQTSFSRVKNIDFYSLFAFDSSSANYGLWAGYPHMTMLNGLRTTLAAAQFDRIRATVVFMRRDASDANANGLTSDLIAFTDTNADLIDDYDPNIRYFDQNANGNFWQTYVSGGRIVAEQPDTHIKSVTLEIYRRGSLACSQTELISLEQFNPASNPSSEAVLALLISTPSNNVNLYRANAAYQAASRALAVTNSYPADVLQLRADLASPMMISGETDPLADANFYIGTSGILAASAADPAGAFTAAPVAVTAALVEGANQLTVQATKATYTSPLTRRDLILDIYPPSILNGVPTGTVDTLAPYVAADLFDLSPATDAVSGICPDMITFKINGATVPFSYDSATGAVVWVDSVTNTVPVISSGSYTALVEVGDYAGYKATQSWTFTADFDETDNSAPSIANKSPIGMAGSQLPVISVRVFDNQSGVIPSSIELRLDGAVVVDASNIGASYDPSDGTVSFTPSSAFVSGSNHTAQITVSHFASDPADKITSVDSWNFSIP